MCISICIKDEEEKNVKLLIFNAHFSVTCRRLISERLCVFKSYIIASRDIYGEICSKISLSEGNINVHGQYYVLDVR